MRVYFGADHAGFKLKNEIKQFVADELHHEVIDLGTFSEDSVDYPDLAREVAEKVVENPVSFGILLCGTGVGMCMVANKQKGIRAVDVINEEIAEMSRRHNDANVLCLGGRTLKPAVAKKLVKIFLDTKFDGDERHVRRIAKMDT